MSAVAKTTWILVAHRAGATVFQSQGPGVPLARIAEIENAEARPADPMESRFAVQLAAYLEQARVQAAFERLVLVAPARLLGKLREALSEPLRSLLVASLARDLGHSNSEQLRNELLELALALV